MQLKCLSLWQLTCPLLYYCCSKDICNYAEDFCHLLTLWMVFLRTHMSGKEGRLAKSSLLSVIYLSITNYTNDIVSWINNKVIKCMYNYYRWQKALRVPFCVFVSGWCRVRLRGLYNTVSHVKWMCWRWAMNQGTLWETCEVGCMWCKCCWNVLNSLGPLRRFFLLFLII